MQSRTLVLIIMLSVFSACSSSNADSSADVAAIKKVIETSYVHGIHIDRDPDAIRSGFHPAFNMLVLSDNQINPMPIESWIERIEAGKAEHPEPSAVVTTHKFSLVDVTGSAAVARIEVFKDEIHVFTDYMSLYKFSEGWKIVNKIFYRHPKSAG